MRAARSNSTRPCTRTDARRGVAYAAADPKGCLFTMANNGSRAVGCLGAALVLVLVAGVLALAWARQRDLLPPLMFEQRCVATAGGDSVVLTGEQAYYAAIVAGVGVGRDIGEHGVTIALATVYQETGIRNLTYGDRDSLGLFQQRPSQDWGTPAQIVDPWYSSGQFYDALLQIPGWESGDVNDTAQAVQRSGHPDAYRKHEPNARVLAQVFTGAVSAGLSCFDESVVAGDAAELRTELELTFGDLPLTVEGNRLRAATESPEDSWAIAAYAVAHAGTQGIESVATEGRIWRASQRALPDWVNHPAAPDAGVLLELR